MPEKTKRIAMHPAVLLFGTNDGRYHISLKPDNIILQNSIGWGTIVKNRDTAIAIFEALQDFINAVCKNKNMGMYRILEEEE